MKKLLLIMSSMIWIALAAFEAAHDLSGNPWGTFALWINLIGVLYVPLWLFSAVNVWRRSIYRTVYLSIGAISLIAHGAVIGDMQGMIFFASGPILAALLLNADKLEKQAALPVVKNARFGNATAPI